MDLNSLIFWLDGFKAFVGLMFGVFAVIIYWKVRENEDLAMNSFQLNKEEIAQDYKIILYSNIMLAVGYGSLFLASIGPVSMVVFKAILTAYILTIMFVLVRWVRLFR